MTRSLFSFPRLAFLSFSRRLVPVLGLALLVGVCLPFLCYGQQQPPGESEIIQEFARPGQPTIIIYLWGNVGASGLWRVEPSVDLISLLSAAQVPGIGKNSPGIRRTYYVNIYRGSEGNRQQVYREKLSNLLNQGAVYPQLKAEDVIEVEQRDRRSIGLRTISSIVGTASSMTLLILRLSGGR